MGPAELARKEVRYVAAIGDLAGSRNLPDRADVQRKMLGILKRVNGQIEQSSLVAPLTLTAGDEIQTLLSGPPAVVQVVQELTDRTSETAPFPTIVFDVGWGTLTTGGIRSRHSGRSVLNPALLDGPAFHRARAALESAQRAKVWARFDGFGEREDMILNALFALMGAVRSRWTSRQATLSYHARNEARQKDVAAKLRVSPSVVSESLKAANHEAVLAGESAARTLLTRLDS